MRVDAVICCCHQVNAIETGADALTAVVFHSFHLLLISVDNKGYVRVNNGADGNLLNAFHVSNGESREQVLAGYLFLCTRWVAGNSHSLCV